MKFYLESGTILYSLPVFRQKQHRRIRKSIKLPFLALLSILFCIDTSLAHENPHSNESITTTARDVDNSEDRANLEDFVKHASLHLLGARNFTESLNLLNDFRGNRDWFYGSTYLILLTKGGGVYTHPKDRELEDQDWSQEIVGCDGESWREVVRKRGGCVKYVNQPDDVPGGYAMVARGPFVPFGNPTTEEAEFVLVGGLDHTPEPAYYSSFEELEDGIIEGFLRRDNIPNSQAAEFKSMFKEAIDPFVAIDAGDVRTQDDLRTFLTGTIGFISASLNIPLLDPVIMRRIFRFEGGPWRNGSTYIYIMDINGNVIFNGANRNIEQTDLWNFEGEGGDLFIRRIIDAAREEGGGFVEYDWDDPNIEGDEPHEAGAAGGTSSKLGYAVLSRESQGDHSRTYVFGTGLYFEREEIEDEDDGGCSLAAADSAGADIPANSFLIFLLLFFAVSVKSQAYGKKRVVNI